MSNQSPGGSGSSRKTPSTRLLLRAMLPGSPPEEVYVSRRLSIGRSVDNVFCIEHDGVDRHHAEVEVDQAGRFVLRCLSPDAYLDLGRERVPEVVLEPGLRFQIGPAEFECVAGDPRAVGGDGQVRPVRCPKCGTGNLPRPAPTVQHCLQCHSPILVLEFDGDTGPLVLSAQVSSLELLRFAGRGGMGVVLEGRNLADSRRVAIKLMLPHLLQQEEYLRRFRREIALLRAVRHPHVVRILGWGAWNKLPCIVMEWIDGQTLKQWIVGALRRRPCPWDRASQWFGQVAAGLWAIHQAGLVHRDIKPSNILIDQDGKAHVADLGVARRVEDASTALTTTGLSVRTFAYMAPEQMLSPERVDARADQYGLGATFYELLTGQLPLGRWLPASQRNPTVPFAFDQVLQRLLEHEAGDRYSSLEELADELRRLRLEVPLPGLSITYDTGQLGPGTSGRAGPLPPPLSSPPPLHPGHPFRRSWTGREAKPSQVWANPILFATASAILIGAILFAALSWRRPNGPGTPILQLGHAGPVNSVAFSPDGRRIVTASLDGTARVWDAATGNLLLTLQGHAASVFSAAYSPDGRRIVTASWDKTARVWDAATGNLLLTLQGHAECVRSAAYSPDGRRIVTTSRDRTARVWDAATGNLLLTLQGHAEPVSSAAYSPDGRRIVTASEDDTARVWDAASGREIARLVVTFDGEWLAVTPRGYFVSSEGARGLVRHSDGRGGLIPEEESLRYHRPDLVQKALQQP